MASKSKIIEGMKPFIDRAVKGGKWFYHPGQQILLSPLGLMNNQREGKCMFTADVWSLVPIEQVQKMLEGVRDKAQQGVDDFHKEIEENLNHWNNEKEINTNLSVVKRDDSSL